MEDKYESFAEPKLSILTQGDYDELRAAQIMLTTMAKVIHAAENLDNCSSHRMPRYSDIHRFMTDIGAQVGAALDGIRSDDGVGPPYEA